MAPEANGTGMYAASLADIQEAAERIKGVAHITPVLTSSTLDRMAGHKLFFKCEIFQKCGAFKFRGAFNSVRQLTDQQAAKGVVTHSSGNHAASLALAAKLRGIPAHIVVPRDAPGCKQAAVKEYGGNLILCQPTMAAREATAAKVAAETGATYIPPYDYPNVIAGQGTIGLELLQQVPQLDVIVVPVSGGGMLSGITLAAKALKPDIIIIAAEPSGSNDAADVAASKAQGRLIQDMPKPVTVADGLEARLGQYTWPVVRDLVDQVVVVPDSAIVQAMQLIFERMKLVVEPSGAAGLAAVLSPGFSQALQRCKRDGSSAQEAAVNGAAMGQPCGKNVGIILCGGNLDFESKGFFKMENWKAHA